MTYSTAQLVAGSVAAGFEPAAEVFERIVLDRPGHGAAVTVEVAGTPVLDLVGGATFGPDSITMVFSTTKGVSSIAVATLVQRGVLAYDRPVVTWWPEFGAAGKDAVTLRQLMAHQAGLPAPDGDFTLAEWQDGTVADALARQTPEWAPGTAHGYHAATLGALLDGVCVRADGRTVGAIVSEDVAGPLGADFWIGLPDAQEHRAVDLTAPAAPSPQQPVGSVGYRAFNRQPVPMDDLPTCNDLAYRRATIAAVTGMGSSRGLARIYSACVSDGPAGPRLLSEATVRDMTREQARGTDLVAGHLTAFGAGFQLSTPRVPMTGAHAFGHDGLAGSVAFADASLRLAFAFVTDRAPVSAGVDPAAQGLVDAVLACLRSRG